MKVEQLIKMPLFILVRGLLWPTSVERNVKTKRRTLTVNVHLYNYSHFRQFVLKILRDYCFHYLWFCAPLRLNYTIVLDYSLVLADGCVFVVFFATRGLK